MQQDSHNMAVAAAFRCPPEVLLRPLIRRSSTILKTPRPCVQLAQTSARNYYRGAVCVDYEKPLEIQDQQRMDSLPPGYVRIAIQSCGVNFSDILLAKGQYQLKLPPPFVPGSEIAGEITEVGEDVQMFQLGDRVLGTCQLNGFGEETIAKPQSLWRMPPQLSYNQAAAVPVSYGTAMLALTRRANIQPGETILITAAAGGVGLATVDIAKHVFNATVIGAAGGPEKCALVKRKGADHVIDYTTENVRDRVKEITNGKGVSIVCDQVGGDIFIDCLKSLAWEGRIVVIGFASGNIPKIPANLLLLKNASAMGVWWGEYLTKNPGIFRKSVTQTLDFLADEKLSPHVSKTYTLDEVNEAFNFVGTRQSVGKVVVNMS